MTEREGRAIEEMTAAISLPAAVVSGEVWRGVGGQEQRAAAQVSTSRFMERGKEMAADGVAAVTALLVEGGRTCKVFR